MDNYKKFFCEHKIFSYFLSFLIPIILIILICFVLGYYPFGNKSYIFWDSDIQFVPFLSHFFKTVFTPDFLFSFSKEGGNGMFDFNVCYQNNPLNFLVFLFPENRVDIAFQTITIIKIGLCALSFSFFLNHDKDFDVNTLIFSTAYGLSTCAIFYSQSIMAFETMYLLPPALAGINKIIKEQKILLFVLFLSAAFLMAPYSGWVILVFSFCYLIYLYFLNLPAKEKRVSIFKYYFISLLFVFGISAIITIPTVFFLPGTRYELILPLNELMFQFPDLASNFYTGVIAKYTFWKSSTPLLYCGILPFILFISYFFNKGIDKRERLIDGLFASLLIFAFSWHITFTFLNCGVVYPRGCIYRFTCIFLFIFLYFGYKNFTNLKSQNKFSLFSTAIIFSLITVFVFLTPKAQVNRTLILCDLFLGYIFLLLLPKARTSLICLSALMLFHFGDLTVNGAYCFHTQELTKFSTPEMFKRRYDDFSQIINYIKSKDKGFYRIESSETTLDKHYLFDGEWNNLSVLMNYNSISHYSTVGKTDWKEFYDFMGYDIYLYNNIMSYNDNMPPFALDLLGVKYIISNKKENINNYKFLKEFDLFKPIYLYENENALPLGFLSNKELLSLSLDDKNLFERYNQIPKYISGVDLGNIFNVSYADDTKFLIANNLAKSHIKFDDTNKYWLTQYLTPHDKYSWMTINDKIIRDFKLNISFNVEYLGEYNKGDEIDVILYKYPGNYQGTGEIYYASMNSDIEKKYFDLIKENSFEPNVINSTHIIFDIKTDKDSQLFVTTIPYDENWEIKLDGKKVKQEKVFNALTGISVSNQGEHKIEMCYKIRFLLPSALISLISLICLFIFCL